MTSNAGFQTARAGGRDAPPTEAADLRRVTLLDDDVVPVAGVAASNEESGAAT